MTLSEAEGAKGRVIHQSEAIHEISGIKDTTRRAKSKTALPFVVITFLESAKKIARPDSAFYGAFPTDPVLI